MASSTQTRKIHVPIGLWIFMVIIVRTAGSKWRCDSWYMIYSKRLRPIPPGLGSRFWNLGRCLLEPCWGLLGAKLGVVEV